MVQRETAELLNIMAGGVLGAVAGALMSLLVNFWLDWNKRQRLHGKLVLEIQLRSGHRVTVRIHNGYVLPLSHVYAYITVEHDPSDILNPPFGWQAYIKPGDHNFGEDRLCWSLASNPPNIDIYAGEKQSLDVLEIGPSDNWIQIPSESGWGSSGGTARVFLRMNKYNATIKIVSKETKAKEFSLQIDPFNKVTPLSLR